MVDKFVEYVEKWYKSYYHYATNQLYVQFHITRLCESRCAHCYFNVLEPIKNTLSLEQCKYVIDNISQAAQDVGRKALVDFTGGDPLLHPDIYQILKYCCEKNISTGLKCNSHMISTSSINMLKECNVERIYLSLEGLENTNDMIRGKGDFNRTIKAISLLKEQGFYVRVHMTISKQNMNDVIELMNFFVDNKFIIDVFSWSRFWSSENSQFLIDWQDFKKMMENQFIYLKKLYNSDDFYVSLENGECVPKIGFEFKEHLWFPFLLKKNIISYKLYEDLSLFRNSINCSSTRHVYIIDNNGDVLKCRKISDMKIGNIFTENFSKMLFNSHNKRCAALIEDSECGKCKYYNVCAGCPAMAYAKNFNRFSKDPDCFLDIN